jgi:hypothetical protein
MFTRGGRDTRKGERPAGSLPRSYPKTFSKSGAWISAFAGMTICGALSVMPAQLVPGP